MGTSERPRIEGAVLVVGAGGLGCPATLALALAGVETIGVADPDSVELSNLHRQILHGQADLGSGKAESAAAKVGSVDPSLRVRIHAARVTTTNVAAILADYDFVIDATDDPPTKFLLNDAAVVCGKPLTYAGVVGLEGQILTILPRQSACLRCLFPEPPAEGEVASCSAAGILGPLAGLVGALEAGEAIKYLTRSGDLLTDRLLRIDGGRMAFREVPLRPSPACPLCSRRATIHAIDGAR
jgi:molybdopterin/thiamine biosynthesis adenylyltransferase